MDTMSKGYASAQPNYAAQAVACQPELERLHDRLSVALSRVWEANERLCCAADRIGGGGAKEGAANKSVSPISPGILGKIEKTLESMEEAASALEDRAAYFSRLA